MNTGHLPTCQLHDINWGTLDQASRAPQVMSCNYCACVCYEQLFVQSMDTLHAQTQIFPSLSHTHMHTHASIHTCTCMINNDRE